MSHTQPKRRLLLAPSHLRRHLCSQDQWALTKDFNTMNIFYKKLTRATERGSGVAPSKTPPVEGWMAVDGTKPVPTLTPTTREVARQQRPSQEPTVSQ